MSSGFLSPKIFLETAFHLYSKETFSSSKTEERKKREDEMRSIVINHDLHWTQGTRNTDSSILAELQLSIIYVRRLEYFSMAAQATSLHWVDWKQLIWDSTLAIGEAESLKLISKYLKLTGTETRVENSLKVK
ncbi:unnamed protein product [Victoria cruziana]